MTSLSTRVARLPFFYGWVVVAIAFISMAIGVNARTAFSLLYPPILAEFSWPRGVTAATFSIGFLASTMYSPVIGVMMDRWGPRIVVSLGAVMVSIGLVLTTFIQSPLQLYLTLGVLVVGGSVGLSYTGHGAFVPGWFDRKRGFAVGIAFSGVGLGSIIMFPWLQHVIDSSGWRHACLLLAIVVSVVLVPINLVFQRHKPADMGLLPDGDPALPNSGGPIPVADNVVNEQWTRVDWTLRRAMATRQFWFVFAGFVCGMFAWYTAVVHQTQFLIDIGISRSQAALALGLVPLLGVGGQIGFGYLSDRLGREWGWSIGCVGFVLCYALFLALERHQSMSLLLMMIVAQGLLGYSLTPNFGSIPAELFQGRHYGSIFGVLSMAAGMGAAAGPWLSGEIYDRSGSYVDAFALCVLMSVLSCLFIWLAGPRKVRVVAGRVPALLARR